MLKKQYRSAVLWGMMVSGMTWASPLVAITISDVQDAWRSRQSRGVDVTWDVAETRTRKYQRAFGSLDANLSIRRTCHLTAYGANIRYEVIGSRVHGGNNGGLVDSKEVWVYNAARQESRTLSFPNQRHQHHDGLVRQERQMEDVETPDARPISAWAAKDASYLDGFQLLRPEEPFSIQKYTKTHLIEISLTGESDGFRPTSWSVRSLVNGKAERIISATVTRCEIVRKLNANDFVLEFPPRTVFMVETSGPRIQGIVDKDGHEWTLSPFPEVAHTFDDLRSAASVASRSSVLSPTTAWRRWTAVGSVTVLIALGGAAWRLRRKRTMG